MKSPDLRTARRSIGVARHFASVRERRCLAERSEARYGAAEGSAGVLRGSAGYGALERSEKRAGVPRNAVTRSRARTGTTSERRWCSGITWPCQGHNPGSNPGRRTERTFCERRSRPVIRTDLQKGQSSGAMLASACMALDAGGGNPYRAMRNEVEHASSIPKSARSGSQTSSVPKFGRSGTRESKIRWLTGTRSVPENGADLN